MRRITVSRTKAGSGTYSLPKIVLEGTIPRIIPRGYHEHPSAGKIGIGCVFRSFYAVLNEAGYFSLAYHTVWRHLTLTHNCSRNKKHLTLGKSGLIGGEWFPTDCLFDVRPSSQMTYARFIRHCPADSGPRTILVRRGKERLF